MAVRLYDFIREHRDELIDRWLSAVRGASLGEGLSHPALQDHIPEVLEELAEAIDPRSPSDMGSGPDLHALTRLGEGFDVAMIVREYSLLRHVIFMSYRDASGEDLPLTLVDRTCSIFEEAIRLAVQRYSEARARTLGALDRISSAAVEDRGLQGVLGELVRVLHDTNAAVDTVAILLREGDRLVVRAAIGLDEELLGGFSLRIGEGFSGMVAAQRKAMFLPNAADDPLVRSPALRARGVRALFGMPLIHGDEVIGVAQMGSTVAPEFSSTDRQLFRVMAQHAGSLVAQAQLADAQRRAREEADRTQALLDASFAASPVGVALLDANLRYLRVNDTLAALNGKPAAEHVGCTVRDVLGDGADVAEPPVRTVLKTRSPLTSVEFSTRPPGLPDEVRDFLASYYPVLGSDGEVLGVGAAVVDITERKRMEEALRDSEQRFRLALQNSGTVVFEQDADLRYRWIYNSQLGYSDTQVVGKTDEELLGVGSEELTELKRQAMRENRRLRAEVTVGRDSELRYYVVEVEPRRDEHGQPQCLVGAATDITERKHIEHELHNAARFREEFIGILGHDLRSPVTAIRLSAHLLYTRGNLKPPQARSVARIADSADRMERMIRDLLDFTRGRMGGGLSVQRREADLGEVCRRAVEELNVAHPDAQIELDVEGDVRGVWDEDRAAQAVTNLVSNAIVHGRRGTPIRISVVDDGSWVRLGVTNAGERIPDELRTQLFQPFRRRGTHGSGLGLGLYIVKLVADAHGGEVRVSSDDERGTTFTLTLPRLPIEERAAPTTH